MNNNNFQRNMTNDHFPEMSCKNLYFRYQDDCFSNSIRIDILMRRIIKRLTDLSLILFVQRNLMVANHMVCLIGFKDFVNQ